MVNLGALGSGLAGGAAVNIVINGVDNFSGNFKKASTGLQKLGVVANVAAKGFLVATTALAGIGVASIKSALKMKPMSDGFKRLTKDSDNFLKSLKKSTKGTVSSFELMSSTNRAMLLGLDQDALPSLFKNAAIVGRAAGRSTTEAIEDITIGIGRQSRLILDNLGIIVKAESANKTYAASIGKIASELTEAEKKTAFTTAAIASLQQKATDLGGSLEDDAVTSIQTFTANMTDAFAAMGTSILENLEEPLKDILPLLETNLKSALEKLQPVLISSVTELGNLANVLLVDLPNGIDKSDKSLGSFIATWAKDGVAGIRLFTAVFKNQMAFTKALSEEKLEIDELVAAGVITQAEGQERYNFFVEEATRKVKALNKETFIALEIALGNIPAIKDETDAREDLINTKGDEVKVTEDLAVAQERLNAAKERGGFSARVSKTSGRLSGLSEKALSSIFSRSEEMGGQRFNDFISRPGQPAAAFSNSDTIIGVKDPSKLMGGGGSVNVHIENVNGLDGTDVASALQDVLNPKINYG